MVVTFCSLFIKELYKQIIDSIDNLFPSTGIQRETLQAVCSRIVQVNGTEGTKPQDLEFENQIQLEKG